MKKYDIVLLTDPRYDQPSNPDKYAQNILKEDALVQTALEKLGVRCFRTSWDNPTFDWSSTTAVLFRTTWDYMDRFEAFGQWFEKVNELTTMYNSYETIQWNLDKNYLQDLAMKGIRIPETVFIPIGEEKSLPQLLADADWQDAILKPAISAGARHTYRINPDNVSEYKELFAELIANESMLLQKFQNKVTERGEVSLMMINGEFTHAILKKAKAGDFRVQDDYGGTLHEYEASAEEIDFAKQAVQACDETPAYARVDIIWNDQDEPCLGELELIEPEMWFRYHPAAAELLAKHLKSVLTQK